jgi:hypothetical protein
VRARTSAEPGPHIQLLHTRALTAPCGEAIIRFVMIGHAQVPSGGSASTVPLDEVRQVVARIVLVAFVTSFMAARVLVFLIVSRRIPDLFLHIGGTHIHHLNYGIFLLSGVGAYLLLMRAHGRRLLVAAAT